MADTTTIEVSRENWQRLNTWKMPGDSFDDALGRVLEKVETGFNEAVQESIQESHEGEETPAECSHCGHSWNYGGNRTPGQNVTCPACSQKTEL